MQHFYELLWKLLKAYNINAITQGSFGSPPPLLEEIIITPKYMYVVNGLKNLVIVYVASYILSPWPAEKVVIWHNLQNMTFLQTKLGLNVKDEFCRFKIKPQFLCIKVRRNLNFAKLWNPRFSLNFWKFLRIFCM